MQILADFPKCPPPAGHFWCAKMGRGIFGPAKMGRGKKTKSGTHIFLTSQVRCTDMPAARQTISFFAFLLKKH